MFDRRLRCECVMNFNTPRVRKTSQRYKLIRLMCFTIVFFWRSFSIVLQIVQKIYRKFSTGPYGNIHTIEKYSYTWNCLYPVIRPRYTSLWYSGLYYTTSGSTIVIVSRFLEIERIHFIKKLYFSAKCQRQSFSNVVFSPFHDKASPVWSIWACKRRSLVLNSDASPPYDWWLFLQRRSRLLWNLLWERYCWASFSNEPGQETPRRV